MFTQKQARNELVFFILSVSLQNIFDCSFQVFFNKILTKSMLVVICLISTGYKYGYRRRWRRLDSKEILDRALKLKPAERFLIIEGLIESIDQPDKKLDEIWIEEAEKRFKAYRKGRLEGIPIEDIFSEKQ